MTNKISFDVILAEKYSYNNEIIYKHSYTSYFNNKISYTSIINGFSPQPANIRSSFAKFTQNQVIIIGNPTYIVRGSANFINGDVQITSGSVGFIQNGSAKFTQVQNIYAQPSANIVAGSIVFRQVSNIYAIPSLQINSSAHFINSDIAISASPTGRQYYMLSYWDGYSVSTLDTMNLSQMDYVNL